MTATLLLTRPQQAAQDFAQAVTVAGWTGAVMVAPLMRIVLRPPDPAALAGAGAGTLVFTSHHGVGAWVAAGGDVTLPVWCVGPRTAQAARDAGFRAIVQPPGGDAVSLRAALLAARPVPPVVHLRGEHAAMALAQELTGAGLPAREVVVYDQRNCALPDVARDLLSRPGPVVVPLFSPRSARLFAAELGKLRNPGAQLHVIAISSACAGALDGGKCSTLRIVDHPDGGAMRNAVLQVQAELEDHEKPR
ncbi:uroporphyrinogen-III synthase [Roseinatronobacter sp. NSM]|uniref:uroporphyrinogen-III synthase n=1 Tax=Roseinatronobacter sp. NSM TaxID=3457785 RepID=UPI00403717A8